MASSRTDRARRRAIRDHMAVTGLRYAEAARDLDARPADPAPRGPLGPLSPRVAEVAADTFYHAYREQMSRAEFVALLQMSVPERRQILRVPPRREPGPDGRCTDGCESRERMLRRVDRWHLALWDGELPDSAATYCYSCGHGVCCACQTAPVRHPGAMTLCDRCAAES